MDLIFYLNELNENTFFQIGKHYNVFIKVVLK